MKSRGLKKRTRARELALKHLYGHALGTQEGPGDFASLAKDQETESDIMAYAQELAEGVMEHRDALTEKVSAHIKGKPWRAVPVLDRVLLLLGAYEIEHQEDTPASVTINEIVELAKRYGTKTSSGLINAVLDVLTRD